MEYIKLMQSEKFLKAAAEFAQGRPLVVCGDLNSVLITLN
jgi:endonuclease/exonuclease/phosphatase family metal-dependent hydrolase